MQLINLYPAELRPRREWLGIGNVLGLLGLLIVMLSALTWSMQQRAVALEQQVAAAEARHDRVRQQLGQVREQWQQAQAQSQHERREARLRAQLIAKRRTLAQLEPPEGMQADGFATLLAAVTRGMVDGVWLSRLAIAARQQALTFDGHALTAERIALFMAGMSQQPALQGLVFEQLELKRSEAEPNRLDFRLSTQTDATEPTS